MRILIACEYSAQTNRVHYASPGAERWKMCSTSYAGIAAAMADQWG